MEVNTVTCILCNGTVNFKNREPGLFNAHMRDQHNIFYRSEYILASCFMQSHQLDKVEEEWANMERMEEVIEVDQDQNELENVLNFEALEDEEVLEQDYDEVGVEVQEVVQLEQEGELPMEEEVEGRKRKSNGTLKCDICEKTYGAKGNLLRHYKKNHSLEGMKRERTEMESEVEENSQMEEAEEIQLTNSAKKRKPNNGEFKCGQCESTYSTKGNLNVHMKKLHGWEGMKKERVEVEDDMTGYESDANSTGDFYSASETEKPACELCTRTFKSPGRLTYHMMTKHKDVEVEGSPNAEERRSISCEQCPKKFVSKTGLRWHTKTKHDNLLANADDATTDEGEVSKEVEEEKKSHPCLHCAKGYMSIQALVRHTKESHSETGGEVGAESNDASEPLDATLETKSEEAAAPKEFVCAFGCGKSYSLKSSRDNHEIKEHNRALKKRGRGKAPVGSTFHLSSQEEELVLEEGVADLSEVVDAEVEAAQNNLAQMEEEVAREHIADATEAGGQEEEVEGEVVANEEEPVAYISFNPLPADPREEWRETQPITAEEEKRFKRLDFYSYLTQNAFRFSEKLLNTKENAVENEMPILPPFVGQEEEEEEKKEEKTDPELEEKADAVEDKEEKVEGKEKGSIHVDLTNSEYFAKHPKAIANPQERSVSNHHQSN